MAETTSTTGKRVPRRRRTKRPRDSREQHMFTIWTECMELYGTVATEIFKKYPGVQGIHCTPSCYDPLTDLAWTVADPSGKGPAVKTAAEQWVKQMKIEPPDVERYMDFAMTFLPRAAVIINREVDACIAEDNNKRVKK